jgi:hypothetical protein
MSWLRSFFGRGRKSARAILENVRKEAGNICVLRVGGVLNKVATDRILAIAAHDIARDVQELKVLLILNDFQGWRRGDESGGTASSARHAARIARIAVVGDSRWEAESLAFLAADHRSREVCFFPTKEESQARAWLAA